MPSPRAFIDQLGREVLVPFPPQRIVSLVPSQTELLADLGLEQQVVGITKFCVRPERWFRTKTRVGGTKKLHLERIRALQPELILANKEENEREQIQTLAAEYPVWVSDVRTLEDALGMILSVGELTDRADRARTLAEQIRRGFEGLQGLGPALRAAYFIWRRPWMVAGSDTFINELLAAAGFENAFGDRPRYPEVSLEELAAARPQVVLLPSEPFPFRERHAEEIRAVLPAAAVKLVDGELFSWYGSRLLYAAPYFRRLRTELLSEIA